MRRAARGRSVTTHQVTYRRTALRSSAERLTDHSTDRTRSPSTLQSRTVAATSFQYGTGALDIAACTVAHASAADLTESRGKDRTPTSAAATAQRRLRRPARRTPGTVRRSRRPLAPTSSDFPRPSTSATRATVRLARRPVRPRLPCRELDRQSGVSVSRIGNRANQPSPAMATG